MRALAPLLTLLLFGSACRDSIKIEEIPDGDTVITDTDGVTEPDTDTLVETDEPDTDEPVDTAPIVTDAEGDGVDDIDDCAPDDPTIAPGFDEIAYDGLDNDCDPLTLDDDLDGDGFALADDCDDDDDRINPDATELCNELDDDCNGLADDAIGGIWYTDADGDGRGDPLTAAQACAAGADQVADATDCDDTRAEAFPGADELCNGLDDDCDTVVDDNPTDGIAAFRDSDDDGFGDATQVILVCTPPGGFSAVAGDCDDADSSTFPGAEERCDGDDDDCDSLIDEDAVDAPTWFADLDGDSFGDADNPIAACTAPPSTVTDATDCDDLDADANPAGVETCNGTDDDCDTFVDEDAVGAPLWFADVDGDGFGDAADALEACVAPADRVADDTDCDDAVPSIFPGAPELCDGLDNDCTGATDDDPTLLATWYADTDGDGFGQTTATQLACAAPAGFVAAPGDCDDTLASVFPGAEETCDGNDEDCNGLVDDDPIDASTWFLDFDGDGAAGDTVTQLACSQPAGWLATATDCDDGRAEVFPGADERCNGADDDCDGETDEDAIDPATFFLDGDGDGFGDEEAIVQACVLPAGASQTAGDCNDTLAGVNPAATEVCNGLDDDCADGADGPDAADVLTFYRDRDGDGFGDLTTPVDACAQPPGTVTDATDCDDVSAASFPGGEEVCDGRDNDCDGTTDVGATDVVTWFADTDGDGFGDAATAIDTCTPPAAHVRNARDCDDASAAVFPGAAEVCNGIDDDCSGDADSDALDRTTWWSDADGDSFGNPGTPVEACVAPPAHAARAGDCDDTRPAVFPGAPEACDGLDTDCNGDVDSPPPASAATWYLDADGDTYGTTGFTLQACDQPDGFVADATDCNDGTDAVFPGNPEICDGLDNDCDTAIDVGATGSADWFLDSDGDGFGNPTAQVTTCSPPNGYVSSDGDCDDADAAVSPAATEVCNGADDNCDGTTDADAVDRVDVFPDLDGDGFGDLAAAVLACPSPADVTVGGDCDDGDAAVNPDADEACDGVDRDCDGTVDGPDPVGAPTWYVDADADGFGNPGFALRACVAPPNYVSNDGDCDDLRAVVFPGAAETCDGSDEDCDGTVDEDDALDAPTWFRDVDGDTFGDALDTTRACAVPSGYVGLDTDCDDDNVSINPDAEETCDDVDRDCDGDPSFGTAGESAVCAAASCLDVLERGTPTMSDWFWLEGTGVPYEEYCDFGTVADGWDFRANLTVDAPAAATDGWVPFVLDIGALASAGDLQPNGEDLRVFTLDGPLLAYWIDLQPGETVAEVWVEVPDLAAGTLDLVVTTGNPDTERKSLSWWFDRFDAVVTQPYGTYEGWSGSPTWSWNVGLSSLTTDATNADYLLQIEDEPVTLPVYVETRARTADDDGVGVMLRKDNGGFVSAAVTNDYAGVQNSSNGIDGIAEIDLLPNTHRLMSWVLSAGNVASASSDVRVGLGYDGLALSFYVDGALVGEVPYGGETLTHAGLATFANSGNPGAYYQYVWLGGTPIDFDPEDLAAAGTGALGPQGPF
jgi:hypothetical protein